MVDQRGSVDTATGDLPHDTNIGFSGRGCGIYGSFATPPERTARPAATPQVSCCACLLTVSCTPASSVLGTIVYRLLQ